MSTSGVILLKIQHTWIVDSFASNYKAKGQIMDLIHNKQFTLLTAAEFSWRQNINILVITTYLAMKWGLLCGRNLL